LMSFRRYTMRLFSHCFPAVLDMHAKKAPYIVFFSFLAVAACTTVGIGARHNLEVQAVVACLALGSVQVSVVGFLSEARYAAKIREHPERGPDLVTYVWGGITVGVNAASISFAFLIMLFMQ